MQVPQVLQTISGNTLANVHYENEVGRMQQICKNACDHVELIHTVHWSITSAIVVVALGTVAAMLSTTIPLTIGILLLMGLPLIFAGLANNNKNFVMSNKEQELNRIHNEMVNNLNRDPHYYDHFVLGENR